MYGAPNSCRTCASLGKFYQVSNIAAHLVAIHLVYRLVVSLSHSFHLWFREVGEVVDLVQAVRELVRGGRQLFRNLCLVWGLWDIKRMCMVLVRNL